MIKWEYKCISRGKYHQEPPGGPQGQYHQKNGVIYRFKCTKAGCKEEYIGELGRSFGARLEENLRAPFPIYKPGNISGQCINVDSSSIVGREVHNSTRTFKEAMFIMFNDPSFNKNLGKFQLPHTWDEVLNDTPAFYLK